MFDALVIGHVTRDLIAIEGAGHREQPGGAAYYTAMVLAGLGLDVAVLTKVAADDDALVLGGLEARGVTVVRGRAPVTTRFENIYAGPDLERRTQRLTSIAPPFAAPDLGDIEARLFCLGPLIGADMAPGFLAAVAARGGRVALDVQGLMREVRGGAVHPRAWREKAAGLASVDVLKADLAEARLLSGAAEPERAARHLADLGPGEVVITMAAEGALVLADGALHPIPALAPRAIVDPTGCGDSFLAGYLARRLGGDDAAAAGRFAAALATAKLERAGPFTGDAAEVRARLRA